jgi:hypothetical protein
VVRAGSFKVTAFLVLGRVVSFDGSRQIAHRLAALGRVQTSFDIIEAVPVDGNRILLLLETRVLRLGMLIMFVEER